MIQHIREYGCYYYDNMPYINKLDVLDAALLKKDYDPQIKFWFHDDVLSYINWTIEPELSLDKLYKIRAEQLRQEFEYLILMYSGGSDSNQILHTFVKNNIYIDEIRSYWPEKIAKKIKPTTNPKDPKGLLSEYHSVIPEIQKFAKISPNTKISILDYSDDIKTIVNDKFISDCGKKLTIVNGAIFQQAKQKIEVEYLNKDVENLKGKKVGVIYGCDKPRFLINNNRLYYYISDISRTSSSFYQKESSNFTPKMFFLTRDLPDIMIKQSHVFLKYVKLNPSILQVVKQAPHKIPESTLIKRLMYPDYNPNIYQKTGKPSGGDIILKDCLEYQNIFQFLDEKNRFIDNTYRKITNTKKLNDGTYNSPLSVTISKPYYIGSV